METKTVPFLWDRETKGTHVFLEVSPSGDKLDTINSAIGRIYLRKSAFGNKVPKLIKVTVEEVIS